MIEFLGSNPILGAESRPPGYEMDNPLTIVQRNPEILVRVLIALGTGYM